MKELSTEEKAKAYDEALERAKECLKDGTITNTAKSYIETIFPELAESEDEWIRKELIEFLKENLDTGRADETWSISGLERWIAWLEKQGEPKEYTFKSIPRLLDMIEPTERAKAYSKKLINTLTEEGYHTDAKIVGECLKQMNGEVVAMAVMDEKQGEQKPIINGILTATNFDKMFQNCNVHKFNVGDWIIFNENHNGIYQVERIDNYRYYLRHYLGGTLSVHFDNELIRLWNISDAKPGDVLASSRCGELWIFEDEKKCHVGYNPNYNSGYIVSDKPIRIPTDVQPATKEQRDLLFQKMKQAGYSWDSEKKELKKIDQKPTWSEEDDKKQQSLIKGLEDKMGFGWASDPFSREEYIDWLNSLKERIGG